MVTAIRTRSISPAMKEYAQRHLQMRQKQLKDEEPLNANTIENDAQFFLDIGEGLMECAKQFRKIMPEPEPIQETEADRLKREIREKRLELQKLTGARSPGRPRKTA